MRIISGIYGRRRFDVPSSFSARPTTDFAKENIFNVVNNLVDLEGMDALDLFAGTGSISFELISRGCRNVTAIEKNNAHASFIAKVAKELKTDALALIRGDVFRYLNSAPKQSVDFIQTLLITGHFGRQQSIKGAIGFRKRSRVLYSGKYQACTVFLVLFYQFIRTVQTNVSTATSSK